MKTRTPIDRNDLRIKKSDKVIEIGPGHNPSFRSNVIVEKYLESDYHRCGEVKIYPHQTFVNADGTDLPFNDNEFDYVICNQVLEHVDDPVQFIEEQSRVAKRGYMETPSLIGEMLFPKDSHKWVVLDIDEKLVLFEKSKLPGNFGNNYGELFLNYLPFQSLPYKLLWLTEGNLMVNRYEWKDSIEYIVNPNDSYYSSFFTQKWTREMSEKLFPRRSSLTEISKTTKALIHVIRNKTKFIFKDPHPITLDEYIKRQNNSNDR
ncbi:MAG: class I SAM-dependent methyltransferase [Tissierellia bacterium]|nr:class I SAM-dependent methyltransferase [Tissierellia bacterium]